MRGEDGSLLGSWRALRYPLVAVLTLVLGACVSLRGHERVRGIPTVGGAYFARRICLSAPAYGQRNPAWAGDRLGSSRETIGSAGCTLCCVSMLLSYYGIRADPKTLNDYLSAHGGYTATGLLKWERCVDFSGDRVHIAYMGPPDYVILDQGLLEGRPSIVKVILASGKPHWLLVVGKVGREYLALDPLGGASLWPLSRYGRDMYAQRVLARNEDLKQAARGRGRPGEYRQAW